MNKNEPRLSEKLRRFQRNEITEHFIYKKLGEIVKDRKTKDVLTKIAEEEYAHYHFWNRLAGSTEEIKPNWSKVYLFLFLGKVFGLSFSIKLAERGENLAQQVYGEFTNLDGEVKKIIEEEEHHEKELIDLIEEEKLLYISSMILGLNDALVELSGALVGYSFAFLNTRLVAIIGLITGIAASLSMAAAEYLSTQEEDTQKNPLKASLYTGLAYVVTVGVLIMPYMLFSNIFLCLFLMLGSVLLIILLFTFYISVAKDLSFRKRFGQMAGLSLTIAAVNFGVGILIKKIFNL